MILIQWVENNVRCTGAAALSEALKVNTVLTEIDLEGEHKCLCSKRETYSSLPSGNHIGDMGATALSEALKTNSTLTHLDLESGEHAKRVFAAKPLNHFLRFHFHNRKRNRRHGCKGSEWCIEDKHRACKAWSVESEHANDSFDWHVSCFYLGPTNRKWYWGLWCISVGWSVKGQHNAHCLVSERFQQKCFHMTRKSVCRSFALSFLWHENQVTRSEMWEQVH